MTAEDIKSETLQACVDFFDPASPRNPGNYGEFLKRKVPQLKQLLKDRDYQHILQITIDHGEACDKDAQVALITIKGSEHLKWLGWFDALIRDVLG
jgi:hypothetical protein